MRWLGAGDETVSWTQEEVLHESAQWVSPWAPPGADLVVTDRILLYIDRDAATIVRAEPDDPWRVEDLVDAVLTMSVARGAARASWTVRPGPVGEAVLEVLHGRGGVVDELIDICGWDLTSGLPTIPVPADVAVRPVRNRDDVAALQRIDAEVWGYRELNDREIDQQVENLMPGRFIALVGDRPAGSAGYGLVDPDRARVESVARLWGAGVVSSLRGRGAYRGLLAARLDDARARGATLALVHSRAGTSGPVLRRIGFEQVGQQTVVAVSTKALP